MRMRNWQRVSSGRRHGLANPFNAFTYDIDFVGGTAKGTTQPYGNNTNDGRAFRDPNNVGATFVPNAAGLLVTCASAGLRRSDPGHWQYPAHSQRALWNRDLTNVAWTKTNLTATKNQTGADGSANAASSITATAANGTVTQAVTLAQNTFLFAVDIKRLVGTGTLEMTVDGGTTWQAVTGVTTTYSQKFIVQTLVTNPVCGFRIGTSGDSFAVDFCSLHTPANAGVNIPVQYRVTTTTAVVSPGQSRPTADAADLGPLIGAARGPFGFYWQGRSERGVGAGIITGATSVFCTVITGNAVNFAAGGGTAATATGVFNTGLGSVNKIAGYYDASGNIKVACNGVVGVSAGATAEPTLDHWDLGTNGAGARSIYGLNERFAIGAGITFTDSDLQAMTT